nr:N-6 DNA methylase [Corynebacterium lactis]
MAASPKPAFTQAHVSDIISRLAADSGTRASARKASPQCTWRAAVTALCEASRPDLGDVFEKILGVPASSENFLEGLSIAEIGMIYEALLATTDPQSRKDNGQYFTPDDAATFMASQAKTFPAGARWLDPCCGVGNLAWHLCAASENPQELLRKLTLVDQDETALLTAVCILGAEYAAESDASAVHALLRNSRCGDFLTIAPELEVDFAIVNPPYARAKQDSRFQSARAGDLYAYFLERLSQVTRGFISVTPASFLTAAKFSALRGLLLKAFPRGDVFVFDNVPDTLFRGFKFGSTNTSKTNFARATVMVTDAYSTGTTPQSWHITPILRWKNSHRSALFAHALDFLARLRLGPNGEWAKIMPETAPLYDALANAPVTVADLMAKEPTDYSLDIASTPRYFTSATQRSLKRGSKQVIYFDDAATRDKAYLLLNSSLLYWWWRCLDGGITLTAAKLRTLPVPDFNVDAELVGKLLQSEQDNVVTKLNAGKINENVKHPTKLVRAVDLCVLGDLAPDFSRVYSPNLFDSKEPV